MFRCFIVFVFAVALSLSHGAPRTRRFTQGRIFGGTDAAPGAAPYQAAMILTGNVFPVCSGSIISKRTILTTASCNGGPLNTYLVILVGTNSVIYGGATYKLSHFIVHPDFNYPYHDVALLILTEDLQFFETVSTIPLGTDILGGGQNVTMTGWGDIDGNEIPYKLQTIDLKTITNEECQDALGFPLLPSHLCTFTKVGEGLCYGDAGNGLVSNGEIVGIASYAEPCGRGFPDVFTRVSFYVDWINANKV